jgi:hypothetical protein
MVKKAKLVELDFGYRAVSYELTGESNKAFKFNDTATALGRLISPIREMTVQELTKFPELEGWFVLEELEPPKVMEFLNVYGQIGLADYGRREKFNLPRTRTSQGLEVEQFCALVGVYQVAQIQKAKAYFKKNPDDLAKRVLRIWWGTEVPMAWVEKDIRELFKCVRILEILKNKKVQEFNLEQGPELRRLISASDKAPFVIPFGKDSGSYLPTSEKWNLSERQRQALVADFASNVNRFLQPITRYPIRTQEVNEENLLNCGFETFLIQSILSTDTAFKEGLCKRPSCRRPYYKQRSTREFCSTACGTAVRVKKHRKKPKISVQKVRKRKTTAKKGKNG